VVFKKIKEEELKTTFPSTRMINSEEMSEQQKNDYISMYNLYRKLFSEYIMGKLELKKYDDELTNSSLNFKCVDEEKMDVYQYCTSDELKYLYIRNNIHIERLSDQEKNFLINRLRDIKDELDEEARQLVQSTYQKLIFEDVGKDGKQHITFYGPDSMNYTARNDSLIIGMRYDEFDLNGLDDEAWDELHTKQLMDLREMFYKLVIEQKGKVNVPITILQYNDFSVKLRKARRISIEPKNEEER